MEDNLIFALQWWDSLPMQDIRECKNGWANLVMKYYPNKTNCQDVSDEEILNMWQLEQKN